MRVIGVGDDASVVTAPCAIGDMIAFSTDPGTKRVLASEAGDPPHWFVLSAHDWTMQPVTAPSGEVVHQAGWRGGNVVVLASATDGWHWVDGARDSLLPGTVGLDAMHIGFRCSGAICLVRWLAADGMLAVHVDDSGVSTPGPSPIPPGKAADWALLPDGRRALILKSDGHTISIEGCAKPLSIGSDRCLFALGFAASDATSLTVLCTTTNGSSRIVRMPLDGTPATVLATMPDLLLGATMVDDTHALVTSLVQAATASVVDLR